MKVLKIHKLAMIAWVILLFLIVFPKTAYADTGNYTYYITENGIIITGYSGNDSSLIIPEELDGHKVVGLGSGAFSYNQALTRVVIPNGLTSIEDDAFLNCTRLSYIKFTGDAPTMGDQVFSNCSAELVIYYNAASSGFGNPWNGVATVSYIPDPEISPIPEVPVAGITLDKASAVLMTGDSLSLLPSIVPAEATNKKVYWTSSNPDIVAVDDAGNITAVGEGYAVVTVFTEDGGYAAACSINSYSILPAPGEELAAALNYDSVKISWAGITEADGYEIFRTDAIDGEYTKITEVQSTEFNDTGLMTGTNYYYKIRAYKDINDTTVYSDYTPVITVKTLDNSIGSSLFLYMSDLNNRNDVLAKAVKLHNGDPSNTCAFTVSEALRRLGVKIPTTTGRTNLVESHLAARGWQREMNLNLLQPGDIAFTTDKYGNYLGGHSTHTFIFMGWANKDKTLMNICDNQIGRYGSVLHIRPIFNTSLTDATAFFYHTNTSAVSEILKLPSMVSANPIAYNKVKITWEAAPGAYGYKIYRSSSQYGTYNYIAVTRNNYFTDSSVVTGRTYYYKVRAYNYAGTSIIYGDYSEVLNATPSLSAPAAVINSNNYGKVKLSWKGVNGANGYQVFRSTSKNGSYTSAASTSYTSYTKTGLVRGRTYYYKVRAYKYMGKTKVYSNYSLINVKVN